MKISNSVDLLTVFENQQNSLIWIFRVKNKTSNVEFGAKIQVYFENESSSQFL